MTPKTAERKKMAIFPPASFLRFLLRKDFGRKLTNRFKGQKSINNKISGTVTSMGFERSPKTKNSSESLKNNQTAGRR